jgi:hypothetical protein
MRGETARREALGGAAMVAGAAAELITMAFHPTGGDIARDVVGGAARNVGVHALALSAVPLSFYGALALTRRLSRRRAVAELALTFYAASSLAAVMAVVASGFLATELVVRMAGLEGEARALAHALLHYTGSVNQAFARVLVAAASVAIGLWSVAIVRTGLLRRATGVFGCIAAPLTLAVLLSGHLRLDVHGFGAVVLVQSLWLVLVGLELRRQ